MALPTVAAPSAADGAWGAPQTVFSVTPTSSVQLPRVARDAKGDAVAVWERYPAYPGKGDWRVVEAATRRAGGSWSAAALSNQATSLQSHQRGTRA